MSGLSDKPWPRKGSASKNIRGKKLERKNVWLFWWIELFSAQTLFPDPKEKWKICWKGVTYFVEFIGFVVFQTTGLLPGTTSCLQFWKQSIIAKKNCTFNIYFYFYSFKFLRLQFIAFNRKISLFLRLSQSFWIKWLNKLGKNICYEHAAFQSVGVRAADWQRH